MSARSMAEVWQMVQKVENFLQLSSEYMFIPVALETLGPMDVKWKTSVKDISKKISRLTGDARYKFS